MSDPFHSCAMSEIFVEAMQSLGWRRNADFNYGDQRGVGFFQLTAGKARRCSAANAFLDPIRSDKLLKLVTRAKVTRILFDGMRAVGVEYSCAGVTRRARCRGEVILTAGALETPRLLMLSGIGPAGELRRHGIEMRRDLPGVGQNLQDHNLVTLAARTNGEYGYYGDDRGLKLVRNVLNYALRGKGPIASNGSESAAFINLDDAAAQPHLQIYNVGTMWLAPGQGEPGPGVTLMANLNRPHSRGVVRLKSASPDDKAEISPNFLSDHRDLELMVRGLRYLRTILATGPMAAAVRQEIVPGPAVDSDEAIAEYCKASTMTNYHPCGTCRMGSDDDEGAVLDPQLRVRGVEGLRVFDASMMPLIPDANINAPVMAAADMGVSRMMGRA